MELGFASLPWLALLPPALLCVAALFSYLYTILWLKPERLRQKLKSQGVKGPKPSFLFGNIPEKRRIKKEMAKPDQELQAGTSDSFSSNYVATIFPYFLHWSRVYGSIYLYSTGSIQALCVTDPDMVKELANCKSLDLGKPCYLQKELGALPGMGIFTSNGDLWVLERKVIAPEFFMGKVKGMVNLMVEAGNAMLNLWESEIERAGGSAEMVVDEYLRNFSADIISRASFGSSFAQVKEIFNKIRQLQMLMAKQNMLVGVPGFRYLPTKTNREIWSLAKSVRSLILNISNNRKDVSETHVNKDLLQSIIEGAKGGNLSSCTPEDFIVDNCKSIYFAGHETTSTTATWCLLFLASHPNWQSSGRDEVLEVCQGTHCKAICFRS